MANEKYRVDLTGEEVDEALRELSMRSAEAWAVGKRGGTPVDSSDETYQNNAEWYAREAEGAAARAEAAVPAGIESAVLFDRPQTLTEAQKAQARQNINAHGFSLNLLDNANFAVNQRGYTSVVSPGFAADRWKVGLQETETRSTVTRLEDGCLELKPINGRVYLGQKLTADLTKNLFGKTLTASVMTQDGTIISGSFVAGQGNPVVAGDTRFGVIFYYYADGYKFYINAYLETPIVKHAKLEIGDTCTIEEDVPRTYEEELFVCQRYFRRLQSSEMNGAFGFGMGSIGGASILVPGRMVKTPDVSYNLSGIQLAGNGVVSPIEYINAIGQTNQGVCLSASSVDFIAQGHAAVLLSQDPDAYIDLSTNM